MAVQDILFGLGRARAGQHPGHSGAGFGDPRSVRSALAPALTDSLIDRIDRFRCTPAERDIRERELTRLILAAPPEVPTCETDMRFADKFVDLGLRDAHGRRLIERFLLEHGASLSTAETHGARCWQGVWFSLFAVRQSGPRRFLHDLILGGRFEVAPDYPRETLLPELTLLSWIIPLGDAPAPIYPMGDLIGLRARNSAALAEPMREAISRSRRSLPGRSDRDLLAQCSWTAYMYLRSLSSSPPRRLSGTGAAALFG